MIKMRGPRCGTHIVDCHLRRIGREEGKKNYSRETTFDVSKVKYFMGQKICGPQTSNEA